MWFGRLTWSIRRAYPAGIGLRLSARFPPANRSHRSWVFSQRNCTTEHAYCRLFQELQEAQIGVHEVFDSLVYPQSDVGIVRGTKRHRCLILVFEMEQHRDDFEIIEQQKVFTPAVAAHRLQLDRCRRRKTVVNGTQALVWATRSGSATFAFSKYSPIFRRAAERWFELPTRSRVFLIEAAETSSRSRYKFLLMTLLLWNARSCFMK